MMRTVTVIGCGKTKQNGIALAKDLYIGSHFRLCRRYAEQATPYNWGIVSAKYGLLRPEVIVKSYDISLRSLTKTAREKWAHDVNISLMEHFGDVLFVALCGQCYMACFKGLHYEEPLKGLGIGQRNRWLSEHLRS